MAKDVDTERLAALFEGAPDAIVVVDEEGRIIKANERVEELFDYAPAELEGESVELLVPEDAREHHPAQRESFMENPSTRPMGVSLDLRGQRKDGSTFPVDISLSPLETQDGLEVMAAIRDITERETLRRKYQSVLETAPDAMFIADADTREIIEVNRQAEKLVGMSEEELVGRKQTILHPEEEAKRYRELFERHAQEEDGAVVRFSDQRELYVETASGDRIPVEISAQPTELAGRKVVIGVFRDVSNRAEYERKLHRQIERLEKLAEVLSHDLRNPLNVAEVGVDLTQQTGDIEELERTEKAHGRIEQLINDALALIREGHEIETLDPLELGNVASECWQNVQTEDATLEVASNGLIYADARRIRNLFENLFRNAVEHAGEAVSVRVGVYADGFYVSDDGPGIPPDKLEQVLEPGWTTEEDGTGLGLNIVSEIAAAHNWQIDISESDEGGARFDFTGVKTSVYDDSFTTQSWA